MAASEEMSSLFPIFILSVLGLFVVPWTIYRLARAARRQGRNLHCHCSLCAKSPKYQVSLWRKLGRFSTCSNITLVFLWILMIFLVYYIKLSARESQPFEPFSILGLEPNASDSEIKKAYRRLSVQYHPDKNPDPEANAYFVDYISKAYQALTDPVARENFAKWGHPDGRQGLKMGIALPWFLLNINGATGGIILLGLVGCGILLPLLIAVVYLSRSSKYTGNYIMHQTLSSYYYLMKPSLAPSKVMDVLIRAAEFVEIPVRRSDEEPLQKLFVVVRSELNLDPKNLKQEQAKFWKQHPALVKTELLLLAHLTRSSADVPAGLASDFARIIQLTPRLLEELMKMALAARSANGHGWLRPALGVMDLSQSFFQAVTLNSRKGSDRASLMEGSAAFMQLPHFDDSVHKKLTRKKVRTLQEFRDLKMDERKELLSTLAGFSQGQIVDVEEVLDMIPTVTIDVTCGTEGEEFVQEGDAVTMRAWISVKRGNGLTAAYAHTPYYSNVKEEGFWVLLGDASANSVWVHKRITFMDEAAAISSASKAAQESLEGKGAEESEVKKAVSEAVKRVKEGSRLVTGMFEAPEEGTYNLTAFCLSDCWLGCDKKVSVKLKVSKKVRPAVATKALSAAADEADEDGVEDEEEIDEEVVEDESGSEYSEDEEDTKGEMNGEDPKHK
ncbi:hypothetical protein SELMODRAFT_439099 [Selaginella moellendorffii]|uniref:J domain-containing protein n=1 Tax=Selaginella moellendorffii TaxID=88036 RepID=D8R2F1_SELML|nr:dnaJ protein ERDJ2A [Selaginella moellendorffii]EFJ34057.1 hypothetical protein SELMODRAFT_439099 [Selaginella moellendorffii]|eukprot:XP_002965219.1 dnaJ protein ERDJ2A [Selaginella moellendorffii]